MLLFTELKRKEPLARDSEEAMRLQKDIDTCQFNSLHTRELAYTLLKRRLHGSS